VHTIIQKNDILMLPFLGRREERGERREERGERREERGERREERGEVNTQCNELATQYSKAAMMAKPLVPFILASKVHLQVNGSCFLLE
jgi:uncharacterized coiled-coil DUF342 family protein